MSRNRGLWTDTTPRGLGPIEEAPIDSRLGAITAILCVVAGMIAGLIVSL
jgi:hypothetical protein